jgi:hypothetical protein
VAIARPHGTQSIRSLCSTVRADLIKIKDPQDRSQPRGARPTIEMPVHPAHRRAAPMLEAVGLALHDDVSRRCRRCSIARCTTKD